MLWDDDNLVVRYTPLTARIKMARAAVTAKTNKDLDEDDRVGVEIHYREMTEEEKSKADLRQSIVGMFV